MTQSSRRRLRWLGLIAVTTLLATGCESTDDAPAEEVEAGLERFYEQTPSWNTCTEDEDSECVRLEVPLDYDDPEGDTVEITAARPVDADPDQPVLLVNPGGPGSSGVDLVTDYLSTVTTDTLRQSYTVVGFDPRGVSRSEPVRCLSDEELDEQRQISYDPATEEGLSTATELAADFAAACEENSSEILGHVDTESTARDLDVLRSVLGHRDPLNYLGFSYGTKLGAIYAELFPEQVGTMVLDGALDPSLTEEEVTTGQAAGFEQALGSWAAWCAEEDTCQAGSTTDDVVDAVQAAFAEAQEDPQTAQDGRVVPAATLVSGFITPLYSQQSWPALSEGFNLALTGDPSMMLYFADLNAGREADGTYSSNIQSAFTAINCLDYPRIDDPAQMREHADQLAEASPTFGPFLAYGGVNCASWPHDGAESVDTVSAEGAAPILVIGTTGDPATPYEWAPALAEQLESGVLITNEGEGHGSYGPQNECIAGLVDDYFVDGTVPEDGTTC
ncbi:MAG: alpha/beta hydrolase [Micrococcaceae bacterium]